MKTRHLPILAVWSLCAACDDAVDSPTVRESASALMGTDGESNRDDYAISLDPLPIDAAAQARTIEQASLELLAQARGVPVDSLTSDDFEEFRSSIVLQEVRSEPAIASDAEISGAAAGDAAGPSREDAVPCSTDQPRSDEELEIERLQNASARAEAVRSRQAAVDAMRSGGGESFRDAVVRRAVERAARPPAR